MLICKLFSLSGRFYFYFCPTGDICITVGGSGDRERLNMVYWTQNGNFVCEAYAFGGNRIILGILRDLLTKKTAVLLDFVQMNFFSPFS